MSNIKQIEELKQQVNGVGGNIDREPANDFWETDIETIDACGTTPESVDVGVTQLVSDKISALMNKYDHMEWLAYLIGTNDTKGIVVTDIVIPRQLATPVNVFVKGSVDVPIIGVIHSHHDMGNGFSHTDDEYINGNHDISLCVSKSGINGQVRIRTECNRYIAVKAVVTKVLGKDYQRLLSNFLEESDKLITVKTFQRPNMDIGDINDLLGQRTGMEVKDIQGDVSLYLETFVDVDTTAEKDQELEFVLELIKTTKDPELFLDKLDEKFDFEKQFDVCAEFIELTDNMDVFVDELSVQDYRSLSTLVSFILEHFDEEDLDPLDDPFNWEPDGVFK